MRNYQYVKDFEKLGFGLFVHFGLYSRVGKGEWFLNNNPTANPVEYEKQATEFNVSKNWAKVLVKTAKSAGCKYITLTTRHHDGFSLYDTCGLNHYDAPHSACGRDLVREFVDACNEKGIVPFFYHTLLDWRERSYSEDFDKYIDYLIDSVEILCKNYGKIGGLWFDGMWDKPDANWQEDRLYATIRKHQPTAMIINNTGLDELGKLGHIELDSVTFERGQPAFVDRTVRPVAGEMCQVFNDHWGYAEEDCNYKPIREIIGNLLECRKYNCNFLLNVGPKGNGLLRDIDACYLREIGKWLRKNKNFVYGVHSSEVTAENADILQDDAGNYYAVIYDVPMSASENVQRGAVTRTVRVNADVKNAVWLDTDEPITVHGGTFEVKPFLYGTSRAIRVAKFQI